MFVLFRCWLYPASGLTVFVSLPFLTPVLRIVCPPPHRQHCRTAVLGCVPSSHSTPPPSCIQVLPILLRGWLTEANFNNKWKKVQRVRSVALSLRSAEHSPRAIGNQCARLRLALQAMIKRFGHRFVRFILESLLAVAMSAQTVFAQSHPVDAAKRVGAVIIFTRELINRVWGGLRKECNLNRPVHHCGFHHSRAFQQYGPLANLSVARFEALHGLFRQVCRHEPNTRTPQSTFL